MLFLSFNILNFNLVLLIITYSFREQFEVLMNYCLSNYGTEIILVAWKFREIKRKLEK